uniref:KIX domain-containing protein n=1 Tax=Panagrolaimus sp. JU765 TaxID=591449 RepID=A0AC34R9Q6_9BILA
MHNPSAEALICPERGSKMVFTSTIQAVIDSASDMNGQNQTSSQSSDALSNQDSLLSPDPSSQQNESRAPAEIEMNEIFEAEFSRSSENIPNYCLALLAEPESPLEQKEWQRNIQIQLRKYLTGRIIGAVCPRILNQEAMEDQRIKDLINYAIKVEKELFEIANSRPEYFHLLAQKIHNIRKEMIKKIMNRIEQSPEKFTVYKSCLLNSVKSFVQPNVFETTFENEGMNFEPDNAKIGTSFKTAAPLVTTKLIANPEKSVGCDLDECTTFPCNCENCS